MHVLFAEDTEDTREMIAVALRRHGHQTTLAHDGAEAVRLIELVPTPPLWSSPTPPFDVIVMDIAMPVLGGLTAIQQIRALPAGAAVPIVLFTGFDYTVQQARQAGADLLLHKTIDPYVFVTRIEKLVQRGW